MKPNILILGRSGVGKSSSMRNLDPATTAVVNTERKALPFRTKLKQYAVSSYKETIDTLKAVLADPALKVVVVDSFTDFWQFALVKAKSEQSGFAVWDKFADLVNAGVEITKNTNKIVVWIGIEGREALHSDDQDYEVDCMVEGKKLKKLPIASKFEIVLHAKKEMDEKNKMQYLFYTNGLAKSPAKSPFEMFATDTIPNDLRLVVDTINSYYEGQEDLIPVKKQNSATPEQIEELQDLINIAGLKGKQVQASLAAYEVTSIEELDTVQIAEAISKLKSKLGASTNG